MRCFNHPEIEAVGICKVCQKGLCHECAADLQHSIACRDKHEEMANATHSLVLRSMQVQGTAGKAKYLAPVFYAFMGALFVVFGSRGQSKADPFLLSLGVGFLVFAAVIFLANRRAFGASGRDAD